MRVRTDTTPLVFALSPEAPLGGRIAAALGVSLAAHEERPFEDGEMKVRPLVVPRGRDVFVIDSLNGADGLSPNDKLCRLAFFAGALADAGAARVTAVVPYLCYARKDRRTKRHDPVTTRYVAQMLEAVGIAGVVVLEVHNVAAFENAFRCSTESLDADAVFAAHFRDLLGDTPAAVLSPDPGGVKRAERFRLVLQETLARPVATGLMEKHRSGGKVTGDVFAGDVAGRAVIVVDDLISTGGTMARAAAACRAHGAAKVYLAASHGLLAKGAGAVLHAAPVDRIVVTDSVEPPAAELAATGDRVDVLSVAGLLADAIRCWHGG